MWKRIGLAIVSGLVAVLVVEVGLRCFWNNPYAGTNADCAVKLRFNHPYVDYPRVDRSRIDSEKPLVRFRLDGRGYTEPSFRFEDPDFTVTFLGGSTTECVAVAEDLRFPALVSKKLEEKGLRVNTLNGAKSGNTMHDTINVLFNHAIQDDPDVVVVMHAVNDIGVLQEHGNYAIRMGQHVHLGSIGKYSFQLLSSRMALAGLLRKVVTHDFARLRRQSVELSPEEAHSIPDTAPFRTRLCVFIDMCRAFGIAPVLMTQPETRSGVNELTPHWVNPSAQLEFNNVIREVARTKEVPVIDLSAEIAARLNDPEQGAQIFYDGLHVTDYGSQLYADHITQPLLKLLESMNEHDSRVAH
jgi:lysophospholipase L1-like esterase